MKPIYLKLAAAKTRLSQANWKYQRLIISVNWLVTWKNVHAWKSIQLYLWYPNQTSSSTNVNKWTLCMIHKYLDIKAGNIPARPITVFFGGKAAPPATIAQDIIHLIFVLSEVIKTTQCSTTLASGNGWTTPAFAASFLILACESLIKFHLLLKKTWYWVIWNSCWTSFDSGTMDGVNVIIELVKTKTSTSSWRFRNCYRPYAKEAINQGEFLRRSLLNHWLTFTVSDACSQSRKNERLYNELNNKDWFMTLLDLKTTSKERANACWSSEDRGRLDSHRQYCYKQDSSHLTVPRQYNEDIWHLN